MDRSIFKALSAYAASAAIAAALLPRPVIAEQPPCNAATLTQAWAVFVSEGGSSGASDSQAMQLVNAVSPCAAAPDVSLKILVASYSAAGWERRSVLGGSPLFALAANTLYRFVLNNSSSTLEQKMAARSALSEMAIRKSRA